jgi:hypothetical protein
LNALKASRSINFVVSFIAISVARIAFSIALDAGYKTAEMVPKPNIIAKAIGRLVLFKIGTLVGEALVVAVFVREAAAETDETSFIMVLLFFIDGGDKVRNGKSVWVVVLLLVFVTTRERRRKRRFRKQLRSSLNVRRLRLLLLLLRGVGSVVDDDEKNARILTNSAEKK